MGSNLRFSETENNAKFWSCRFGGCDLGPNCGSQCLRSGSQNNAKITFPRFGRCDLAVSENRFCFDYAILEFQNASWGRGGGSELLLPESRVSTCPSLIIFIITESSTINRHISCCCLNNEQLCSLECVL